MVVKIIVIIFIIVNFACDDECVISLNNVNDNSCYCSLCEDEINRDCNTCCDYVECVDSIPLLNLCSIGGGGNICIVNAGISNQNWCIKYLWK